MPPGKDGISSASTYVETDECSINEIRSNRNRSLEERSTGRRPGAAQLQLTISSTITKSLFIHSMASTQPRIYSQNSTTTTSVSWVHVRYMINGFPKKE